jgi:hypothetical protein
MKRWRPGAFAVACAAGLTTTAALPASAAALTGPPTATVTDVVLSTGADTVEGTGGDDIRLRTLTVTLRGVARSYWVKYQDVDNSRSLTAGDSILSTGTS